MLLILIEYCYGVYKGKSNYRLNDTFTSLSIGMISRYPTMHGWISTDHTNR